MCDIYYCIVYTSNPRSCQLPFFASPILLLIFILQLQKSCGITTNFIGKTAIRK